MPAHRWSRLSSNSTKLGITSRDSTRPYKRLVARFTSEQRLTVTIYAQLTSAGAASGTEPPSNGVAEEERRITDLQNRLIELRDQVRLILHVWNYSDSRRAQKEAILRSNEPKRASKPKTAAKPIPKASRSPSPEQENHEDAFWSTPAASGRTLQFTERLLEEEPDFGALSAMSFDSPGPAPPKSVFARLTADSPTKKGLSTLPEGDILGGPQVNEGEDDDDNAEEDLDDQSSLLEVQLDPEHDPEDSVPVAQGAEPEENPDEEATIILPKAPLSAPDNLMQSTLADSQPQTSTGAQSSSYSSSRGSKVRITPELESIVASVVLSRLFPELLIEACCRPGFGVPLAIYYSLVKVVRSRLERKKPCTHIPPLTQY